MDLKMALWPGPSMICKCVYEVGKRCMRLAAWFGLELESSVGGCSRGGAGKNHS